MKENPLFLTNNSFYSYKTILYLPHLDKFVMINHLLINMRIKGKYVKHYLTKLLNMFLIKMNLELLINRFDIYDFLNN